MIKMTKRKITIILIIIFIILLLVTVYAFRRGIFGWQSVEEQRAELMATKNSLNEHEKKMSWKFAMLVRDYENGKLSQNEVNNKYNCIIDLTEKMEKGAMRNILEKIEGLENISYSEEYGYVSLSMPVSLMLEVVRLPEVKFINESTPPGLD